MTQRISFRKEYQYQYQPTLSPQPRDAVSAVCLWCSQCWQAAHRMEYSKCCHTRRVKEGEVSLMRLPRNPRLRPMKHDRFSRSGRRLEVRLIDAGGVMSTDGEYRTWAQWTVYIAAAKVVHRGDA